MLNSFSIAILTYHRDCLLRQLVESVSDACRDGQMRLDQVLIIDTTGEIRGPEIKQLLAEIELSSFSLKIVDSHVRLSIAEGRNLALDHTHSNWLLFLDDDQRLQSSFFVELRMALTKLSDQYQVYKFGIEAVDEDQHPSHIVSRDIPFEHGSEFAGRKCATGGSLLEMKVVRENGLCFDPYWASGGGEDNAFFFQFEKLGKRFVSLKDIKVLEIVPAKRACFSSQMRIYYERGKVAAKLAIFIFGEGRSKVAKRSLISLCVLFFKGLLAIIFRPSKVVRITLHWCKNLGSLIGSGCRVAPEMGFCASSLNDRIGEESET